MFAEKPPKGFEKYFEQGQGGKAKAAGEKPRDGPKQAHETQQAASKEAADTSKSKSNDWNFGMFNQTTSGKGKSSGGGSGRPIGGDGGDKEKWLIFGALGAVALIGSFAFFEMGYREIAWKEFVNK